MNKEYDTCCIVSPSSSILQKTVEDFCNMQYQLGYKLVSQSIIERTQEILCFMVFKKYNNIDSPKRNVG